MGIRSSIIGNCTNSLNCKVVKAFATTANLFVSECGFDVYLACTAAITKVVFCSLFRQICQQIGELCEISSFVNVKMTLIQAYFLAIWKKTQGDKNSKLK